MPELLLQRPTTEENQMQSTGGQGGLPPQELAAEYFARDPQQPGYASGYDAAPASEPRNTERGLTLRDRFFRSRLGRVAMGGLAALGLAGGVAAAESSPAYADSGHVYTVTGTGGDGVWLHSDPGLGDSGDLIKIMKEGT